jgi:signal transduction histidine kinase
MLDQALAKGVIPAESAVTELQGILDGSMRDLHDLSADLSPHILYEIGLQSAVKSLGEELAEGHGFRFVISGDEAMELEEDVRVNLFQMARELLLNVIKHADASSVSVVIATNDGAVRLEIIDDGAGFNVACHKEGFGLAYIRQRVSFLGGELNIVTVGGKGTTVCMTIPMHPTATE